MSKKVFKLIYIVEAAYAIYMYNYFKTKLTIHHPLESILMNGNISNFLKHPIDSYKYESKICDFGNLVGYTLGVWIISRLFIKQNKKLNKIIFTLVFFGSMLMNLNAFVYYIPIFILEKYLLKFDSLPVIK